ncbi:GTP-binding protein [Shimia sp. SDUM112013]|uniref:CobW family GTP-binding protein n=1 Tax=Shimia sp. SDUM112013 TaxID=3136160 RepID=UPI0032F00542
MNDTRIPVTLITGFLGAGKTTLLNALLNNPSSERIAVIVNEFGEAGLDHDLLETSNDNISLMQSGCLCCTVRGELADTIVDLIDRRDSGAFEFDRIVIETTGLADPGPILQTLLVENILARTTRMDGVVTVADTVNGPGTLDSQFEAVSQVAMADLVIFSKTDLATPEQIILFEERVRALNPSVRIVHAVKGEGVEDKLWGLSGLRRNAAPSDVLAWTTGKTKPSDPLANLSGLTAPAPAQTPFSPHDSRIGSASVVIDEPLSDAVFDNWLNTLVAMRGPDILRVKGIVFLEGIELPFAFHGVQTIFDPPVPVRDWPSEDRRSRIVVIGRDISNTELQRSFDMLRATPA